MHLWCFYMLLELAVLSAHSILWKVTTSDNISFVNNVDRVLNEILILNEILNVND